MNAQISAYSNNRRVGNALALQTAVNVGNNVTEIDLARKGAPNAADVIMYLVNF